MQKIAIPGLRSASSVTPLAGQERWLGLLHVYIIEGESVHQSYSAYRRRKSVQSTYRKIACGYDPCGCEGPDLCWGKADPYCAVEVEVGGGRVYRLGRSQTIDNNHDPKWHKEFSSLIDIDPHGGPFPFYEYPTSARGPSILFKVFDDDVGGESYSDLLGQAAFPLTEIIHRGRALRISLALRHPKAKAGSLSTSRLKIELRFYPLEFPSPSLPRPGHRTSSHLSPVPNCYFRRSHGNLVRLYHDAECIPGYFPSIPCATGDFEAHNAWNDISTAIENAQYFIFLAGWSVNPAISLRRHHHASIQPESLGELLKRKAEEGVTIVVLIWDDITSRQGVSWLKDGLMVTYDEYTRDYFRDTKVEVAVVKRIAGDDVGEVSDLLRWTSFTHHQKIVLYDGASPVERAEVSPRRVVGAFVGGLDLTSGRYDTNSHSLFSTLGTAHAADFYNGCLVEATAECGPREPWHDVHGRIEGPAAWDVMQTFLERIQRQAPRLLPCTSLLLSNLREKRKIRDGRKILIDPQDVRSWDIQLFRSLDSEAAVFQNRKWLARFANQNFFVDRSVQQAYIHLINKASSFIYIENQYFLGSSQYWIEDTDVPCHNLVPYELVRRIARAIDEGENFRVYILIPLFPEGAPGSVTVQEILRWQFQTMRMMYDRIGRKLSEKHGPMHSAEPMDYLQFFFVGKREPLVNVPSTPNSLPSDVLNAIRLRRHPIYVHSKMCIIDDEYILVGSANINERSLAGCRDTEIAFGACQPAVTATVNPATGKVGALARGDIFAFRMHLWMEHLGEIRADFGEPHSLGCARLIRALAQENWAAYVSEDERARLPHGHLCPYPIEVDMNGKATPKLDHPNIPGWTCPVAGVRSALLPSSLTT